MNKIKNSYRRIIAAQLLAILALSSMYAQQTNIFHLLQENDTIAVSTLLDADPMQANACLDNGLSALMAAVAFHNLDMAGLLISRGAVVRSGDDHLRAPIHYANWGGDKDMIELLLANGAPIDTRAIGGASPLIHASLNDRFEMCKFLIEKGADIHIQCNALVTPLYLAVLNGNLQYADYLLKAGAEVEVPDFLGRTPLAVAVRDGNLPMAEKLLENGADMFYTDRFLKRSLLHLACIEDLRRKNISPDILLVGSPAGLGPEIAHGIRETIKAAEILAPEAVFILGHEPLERKVKDQLRRENRDIRCIHCAENPGDYFLYDIKDIQ
jgi:ankyrin repeat protein